MSKHLGDFDTSAVVYGKFTTYRPSTGAPYTLAGTPALSVYKDNSTTQSTTGVTLTADFDTVTGLNHFAIDTSADGAFYSSGSFFDIVVTTGTVDSVSAIGMVVGSFTLRKTSALKPATAGRTLVVDAAGLADANMVKAGPSGSGTAQTAGDIIGDTNDIQTRLPAALVGGRMDSSVGAMAANVLTAAATAADFGTEIAAAVWDALTSGMSTVGSIGKKLADWVVGTIDTYTGNTKQTGDAYARLGAPAGASIAADIAAIPAAVWAVVVHTGITALQAMRMFGAMLGGKTSGAGTGTVTFRNPIDTLDAMVITMTGSNRTGITRDLSA